MTLKLRYEQKLVDQALATKLLQDLNKKNRKISEPHIYTLSQDIQSGLFRLNPQPIVIHEDSRKASIRLLDGQHRLTALSRSNLPSGVEMVFCYAQGTSIEIDSLQATIDSGKPRTTSDRGGFQGLGIPQGFLENAARLYTVIGQPIACSPGEVYGWMNAPKASFSLCQEFAKNYCNELLVASETADRHCKHVFYKTGVKKQYLALVYFMAIQNTVKIHELDLFAEKAKDCSSVLGHKLRECLRPGHPFKEKCGDGSKNTSGIQVLFIRDLLQNFINNTLDESFEPILNCREVDGTMFAEFIVD